MLIHVKLDTLETEKILNEFPNIYNFIQDESNWGYSLELEEFFNDKKYMYKTFNIIDDSDALTKRTNIINCLKVQKNNKIILNKLIEPENYIDEKNEMYFVRQPADYARRLVNVYTYNKKYNCNWKYDSILHFCKKKYKTNKDYIAFYRCATEHLEIIRNKCNAENIKLVVIEPEREFKDYFINLK